MPSLESKLVIGAKDETGGAFAHIKAQIAALDKQIATFDKLAAAAGKVMKSTDPVIASIAAGSKALNEQKIAVTALGESLASMGGIADGAAGGQRALGMAIEETTSVMVAQGLEAARVSERIVAAQRRQARGAQEAQGGFRKALNETLPFLGPAILHETARAVEAGATVEEEIARLTAAGAVPDQISQARGDFREFSKTHSGVLESEYLAGYRDARVIAPSEAFEQAQLGARYRAAARNSGVPVTEADVQNVMRMEDELGLKTTAQREDFFHNILKSQQAFGTQISTETMLAAYRNAKQSIYGWSPEFRDKYFPTLLQSSGQQGGTEMMTALNNYIGQHMQQSELRALTAAGFVRSGDLLYNKTGDVRGLKPGAQLFEADIFRKNIAQWSWDFHNEFMRRKGATETGFDDLIARMPRNMAALIAFNVHNEQRIKRDAETREGTLGLGTEGDAYLAKNPIAAFDALKTSIEQFGAAVTGPGMAAVGPALQALAHDIQAVAAAAGDFAKAHPKAAEAIGVAAPTAVAAAGGWLTLKLFANVRKLLGFGRAAAGEAATATGVAAVEEGAAAVGGFLGKLFSVLRVGNALTAPLVLSGDVAPPRPAGDKTETTAEWARRWLWGDGRAPAGALIPSPSPPLDASILEMARRSEQAWRADPEAARGRAMMAVEAASVSVNGSAQVEQTFHFDISLDPDLRAKIDQITGMDFSVPLAPTGRMDTDAAPQRSRGIGHM